MSKALVPKTLASGRNAPGAPSAPSSDSCPNCGSSHLIRDEIRGEIVCADCGLVVDQSALVSDRGQRGGKEDTGREARGWGPVISPLMPDKGLFSEIGVPTRDFQGNSLSRNTSLKFYHLRKLNHRLRAARTHQRNLVVALGELNRLAGVLGLSREVKESATYIYRRALEHKATRGKKIVALVAASVYAACRQCHVPRTMKEIIAHSKATKIEVGRAYTLLARELKLGLKPVEPRDYLVRFTQDLNLSKEVRAKVLELLEQVAGVLDERSAPERDPRDDHLHRVEPDGRAAEPGPDRGGGKRHTGDDPQSLQRTPRPVGAPQEPREPPGPGESGPPGDPSPGGRERHCRGPVDPSARSAGLPRVA